MSQYKNTTGVLKGREEAKFQTMVTAVQITPILKAPLDMADAIRRQRRTRGVDYMRSSPTLLGVKQPVLRAVVTETVQGPKPRQSLKAWTDHSDVIGKVDNSLSVQGLRHQPNSNDSNSPSPDQDVNGNRFVSYNGEGGYAITYNNKGNTLSAKVVNKHFRNGLNSVPKLSPSGRVSPKSSPRPIKLGLTNRRTTPALTDYPDGYNRVLTKDAGVSGTEVELTATDESLPSKPNQTRINGPNEAGNKVPGKSSNERSGSKTSTESQSKGGNEPSAVSRPQSSDAGASCLKFAESVLGAMNSDLSHMYELCNTRVNYSEFIETTEPHRLGLLPAEDKARKVVEEKTSSSEQQNTTQLSSSSKHKPQRISFSSSLLSSSASNHFVPPPRIKLFPSLEGRTRQLTSSKSSFLDPSSLATPISFPQSLTEQEKEAEYIDYDKPIKIIVESNDDETWMKSKKPILKSNSKDTTDLNDRNNNRLSVFPILNPVSGSPNPDSISQSSPTWQARSSYMMKEESSTSPRDKGRLVRFSAQHKIHEFAPTEPVNPSDLMTS